MNYAQRMRDAREDKNLKQSDVALILKTTQSYYAQYENGHRKLPIEHLITLCRYYNISADYMLGLIDEPRQIK